MSGFPTARFLHAWLTTLGILTLSHTVDASADGLAKVRLYSPDVNVDVEGTIALKGKDLNGHLSGNGTNVTVTGTADSHTVTINIAGTIILGCAGAQQFMSGIDAVEGGHAAIDMTLDCPYRPTYNFVVDITLPTHPLVVPTQPNTGESASLQ